MLPGGGGFVSTSVGRSLLAASYAFYIGSDPMLVEACGSEFARDVLFK